MSNTLNDMSVEELEALAARATATAAQKREAEVLRFRNDGQVVEGKDGVLYARGERYDLALRQDGTMGYAYCGGTRAFAPCPWSNRAPYTGVSKQWLADPTCSSVFRKDDLRAALALLATRYLVGS